MSLLSQNLSLVGNIREFLETQLHYKIKDIESQPFLLIDMHVFKQLVYDAQLPKVVAL